MKITTSVLMPAIYIEARIIAPTGSHNHFGLWHQRIDAFFQGFREYAPPLAILFTPVGEEGTMKVIENGNLLSFKDTILQ